jgi:hypothetical protein
MEQELWPPLMCPRCLGMKFICNDRMSQCIYCGYLFMNWSRHYESRGVAKDS